MEHLKARATRLKQEELLTDKESQAVGSVRASVWKDVLLTLGDSSWGERAR
ncbi:MAG: hypothetical protein IPG23_11715 [Burkholderiales bacterium]|nr:hypothetical protein [Burkholderiales bacterium]